MKLSLITASSPHIRQIRKSRFLNFQQITMPSLAALSPPGWQVSHVDEECEAIDFEVQVDLVGITFHTPNAKHAYRIAGRFRARGIPVVLGGPNVTLVPDEAALHADAIFIGEAEGLWQEFLRDLETGQYRKVYQPAGIPALEGVPQADKNLFHRKDYTSGVLFATRGCPNSCDFCTLAVMYKNRIRKRPVEEVAAEYASFSGKIIIFWDDNIAGARDITAISPAPKSEASHSEGIDFGFTISSQG